MTAVRDLVPAHAVRTGESVEDLRELLMESVSPEARNAAQRKATQLAKYATALAVALSDAEVTA